MSPSVIKAMTAFVYLAVLKDFLLCSLMYSFYSDEEMDLFTSNDNNDNAVKMKGLQELITFLLEDFVEVGLQFFYFEKYSFMPDDTVIFNAAFMAVKSMLIAWRLNIWDDEDLTGCKESF